MFRERLHYAPEEGGAAEKSPAPAERGPGESGEDVPAVFHLREEAEEGLLGGKRR